MMLLSQVYELLLLKHLLLVTCLARAFTLLIHFQRAQTIAMLQTHVDPECCFYARSVCCHSYL
jgi:hypothetical protein